MAQREKIGLVLGSGSARGWAHIGIIRALTEEGIRPDIVCGASIGALVGAVYAEGRLDEFEAWVRSLSWKAVISLLDPGWRGGLLSGLKLFDNLSGRFIQRSFEELELPFGVVATDLWTGREVWLREGKIIDAVRASIAMPGLFKPVWREDRFLIDGAVVNPVPVSLARAMGADIVIAVDLGFDILGRAIIAEEEAQPKWWSRILRSKDAIVEAAHLPPMPSMVGVVNTAINVMQVRIARSRLAGEPADVLIAPRLGKLGLLDYHRGAVAIDEGHAAVQRMLPMLRQVLPSS
jgi:NTE family protein